MPTCRAADKGSNAFPHSDPDSDFRRKKTLLGLSPPPLERSAKQQRSAEQQLADDFTSFAVTIQTRLDASDGGPTALGGSVEQQAERALAAILRSPHPGPSEPGYAATTPPGYTTTTPPGYVAATARGYTTTTSPSYDTTTARGYTTTTSPSYDTTTSPVGVALASTPLPPQQEVLRQQARMLADAVLPMIGSVQPLVPSKVALIDVEAFRAITMMEISQLSVEFGRTDGPRAPLVRVLLGGLLGWVGGQAAEQDKEEDQANRRKDNRGDIEHLFKLLEKGGVLVPSPEQEALATLIGFVRRSSKDLERAWNDFAGTGTAREDFALRLWRGLDAYDRRLDPPQLPTPSLAERLIRARELAPALAQDVGMVTAAFDGIGFGFAERQTVELELESAVDRDLGGETSIPRRVTIADILDWVDTLVAQMPSTLEAAGQLGLTLLADEADELFWLVAAIYTPPTSQDTATLTPPEVQDSQVRRELLNLARDLDEFADLAASLD
jgi:hypothetical protein